MWRHYLEAWGNEKGRVHWSRRGTILPPTNPRKLMKKRDFYRLARISRADAEFLEYFIESTGAPSLRERHRYLVASWTRIADANELIQNSDGVSAEDKRCVRKLVIQTEEDMQGQIEQSAKPILKQLRRKQTEFIHDDHSAMAFFCFIAHQYFRTGRIREAIRRELSHTPLGHDFSHLANIVCHMGGNNVGGSLFVDRGDFDITFLESRGGLGFITETSRLSISWAPGMEGKLKTSSCTIPCLQPSPA